LDEEGAKPEAIKVNESRRSSVHSKSADGSTGNESAGDDEDYTEDDPNR